MIEVVAALIEEHGRFLVCQRPAGKARALEWEFAGGKVEPGETGEQALERECREELGVALVAEEAVAQVEYAYPDVNIRLTLYRARIVEGMPLRLEHADICWITWAQADDYPFCPADQALIEMISPHGFAARKIEK